MDVIEFVLVAVYLAVVAGVATIIRFYDVPETEMKAGAILKTYVGAALAIALGAWFMVDPAEIDALFDPNVFITLAAYGLGGMAVFRAFIAKVAPEASI